MAQTHENHARYDPMFHFFVLPLLLINLAFSIYATIHHWPQHHRLFLWWIIMSLAFIVMAGGSRSAALRAQDRIIRLEERLRYRALLKPEEFEEARALTLGQIIALRFADDAELPALALRAAREHLTEKQIKKSIVSWRADDYRV
jgi:hypothetical protein